ncbi:hypothetical protein AVEN_227403-1 [Araneus ventricosus]|uniref:Uncharacterized protein n=1 Tax=Araneus ventricosus TaxID=182803 RepID=A0A4Y2PWZ8_ARAVE|nr:hypothetical protein AVEN_227403-1 [Araneus ventricosus]
MHRSFVLAKTKIREPESSSINRKLELCSIIHNLNVLGVFQLYCCSLPFSSNTIQLQELLVYFLHNRISDYIEGQSPADAIELHSEAEGLINLPEDATEQPGPSDADFSSDTQAGKKTPISRGKIKRKRRIPCTTVVAMAIAEERKVSADQLKLWQRYLSTQLARGELCLSAHARAIEERGRELAPASCTSRDLSWSGAFFERMSVVCFV